MDGDEHRGLGLAVELLHVHAERAIEVEDLRPHRLARRVGDAHAAHAQRVLERPVDRQVAQRIEQPVDRRHRPAVEQFRPDLARQRHEIQEQPALDEARILHADRHLGDQVLQHARRREVIGRADLAQVGHHRGRQFGAVHHQPDDVALGVGEDVVADPRHRQVGQKLVALFQAVEVGAGLGGPDQVVVAQHRALGPSRRARGVEHDGVVRAAAPGDLGGDEIGRRLEPLGAALLHLFHGQQPFVVPHPARVLVHHDFERRHLLLDLQELVDLLLVLGERKARAGMLDDVGELLGDRILVDRHRHAAQRLRGAHRPVEQRAVVADHDQPIAAAEALIGQARGEQADLGRDMAPAMALPDAVFLFAIGRPVGAACGRARPAAWETCPERRSRYRPFPSSSLLSLPGNALFDCSCCLGFCGVPTGT